MYMVIILIFVVVVLFFVLSSRISRLEKMIEGKYVAPPTPPNTPHNTPTVPMPVPVTTSAKENSDLEFKLGGRVFTIIGAIAVVFGVGFFLRYAFAQNLITESMRVVLGIFGGALLLALGQFLRTRYLAYAHILSGGGIALLYLSTYAAYNFYDLISFTMAFGGLAVITAFGVILSLAYDSLSLMALAQVGGFLTPLLLTSGTDHPHSLFVYIAFLNLAVLWVATKKPWSNLLFSNLFWTVVVFLSWYFISYSSAQFDVLFFYATLFFVIFLGATLVNAHVHKLVHRGMDIAIALIVPVFYFSLILFELYEIESDLDSLFAFAFGVLYFALGLLTRSTQDQGDSVISKIMIMLAFVSFAIAVPLQWDAHHITIVWMIVGLAGAVISYLMRNELLRVVALATLMGVAIRIVGIDGQISIKDYEPILNLRVGLSLLFAIALSGLLLMTRRMQDQLSAQDKSVVQPMILIGINLILVWMLSMEVLDFYRSNESVQRVMLSIAWMIYASLLLTGGIITKSGFARALSLALFGVAILKVFLYDTGSLSDFFRFISFISLGIILLVAGYLYYRYKDRIQHFIKGE